MKAEDLEYRLYGLVPYNLSPIQQAIQFGHAVQEYNNLMIDEFMLLGGEPTQIMGKYFQGWKKWRREDKTFIILNGGTTNWKKKDFSAEYTGSLNEHLSTLVTHDVQVAIFNEPDLGDQLTAVVFLVDERVWNKEKYPDRFLGGSPESYKNGFVPAIYLAPESEENFEKRVGGETNVWLREFLRQFKLA